MLAQLSATEALSLIKQNGVFGLGGYDGCLCTHFAVHGVSVDVSCRKSDGAKPVDFYGTMVRVHGGGLESEAPIIEIGNEVARQLQALEGTQLIVRFCSFEDDQQVRCVYCRKPRSAWDDYLCEACKTGLDPFGRPIVEQHSFPTLRFEQVPVE